VADGEAEAVSRVGGSERLDRPQVCRELLEQVGERLGEEGFVEAAGVHREGILPSPWNRCAVSNDRGIEPVTPPKLTPS
jgi:hypothetical protein